MRELLCWLDIETTGLDRSSDIILEVGVILTEMDLTEIDRRSYVLHAAPDARDTADPYVQAMHDRNGLWAECVNSTMTLDRLDETMSMWLARERGDDPDARLYPAGSSVHFDVEFVTRDLPKIAALLNYRQFDVTSIKLLEQVTGGSYDPGPRDPHRVLGDLDNDIEWLKDRITNHGWSAVGQRDHYITMTDGDWAIEHPLFCRAHKSLTVCPVHQALWDMPIEDYEAIPVGRFRCDVDPDDNSLLVYTYGGEPRG